ncbi:MAG: hypothetical protein WHS65_12775 [Melioribacteraceae bacterium]
MKKIFWIVMFMLLLATSLLAMQENPNPVEAIPDVFTSLTGLAAGVLVLTSFIKKQLKTEGTITIIISIAAGLSISTIGWLLKLGIFNLVEWYYIIIYGLIAAIMANGLSTWEIIKNILTALKLKVPKEKEV